MTEQEWKNFSLQFKYGTPEYRRELSLCNGFPYGAELTYKHPYWHNNQYKLAWDTWRANNGNGKEPLPLKL